MDIVATVLPVGPYANTASVTSTTDDSDSSNNSSTVTLVCAVPTVPTVASITQPTCALPVGTIVFTPQAGVVYSIDDGLTYQASATFTALAPGTYTLRVASSANNTCSTPAAATVTIDFLTGLPAVPTVASIIQPTCTVPGTIVFTTQTGVEYSLDFGLTYQASETFTGLAPGVYFLRVRSIIDNNCSTLSNDPVILNTPLAPNEPLLSTVTQPTCAVSTGSFIITNYDSSLTYSASPAAGVTIIGDTVTANPGIYTLKATLGVCVSISSASVIVNVPPTPPATRCR
jgi:hypothetical protein